MARFGGLFCVSEKVVERRKYTPFPCISLAEVHTFSGVLPTLFFWIALGMRVPSPFCMPITYYLRCAIAVADLGTLQHSKTSSFLRIPSFQINDAPPEGQRKSRCHAG